MSTCRIVGPPCASASGSNHFVWAPVFLLPMCWGKACKQVAIPVFMAYTVSLCRLCVGAKHADEGLKQKETVGRCIQGGESRVVRRCVQRCMRISAALLAVLCMSGENDDIAKVRFVADAVRSKEAVFDKQALLDKDLLAALEWAAARSAPEVRKAREAVICAVEHLAEKLVKSGEMERWFCNADEGVRGAAECVNGPLFELLAKKAAYEDSECIELFRQGGCLVGELARYAMFP